MIEIACPSCTNVISVPEKFAGKSGTCRKCDSKITIPLLQIEKVSHAPTPVKTFSGRIHQVEELPVAKVVTTQSCPLCGETIMMGAKKCKHCNEYLDPILRTTQPQPVSAPTPSIVIQNTVNNNDKPSVVFIDQGRKWSRTTAIIASLIIPGLGQIYKGQPLNGILWFVLTVCGYAAMIIPGIILHVLCVVGASLGPKRLNS